MKFRNAGFALVASGVCSYIGAKFFDLPGVGRGRTITGVEAVGASLFTTSLGVGMIAIYYLFSFLVPWMIRFYSSCMMKDRR